MMKIYESVIKSKLKYLPDEHDVILKNGKRMSEMYGKGNLEFTLKKNMLNGQEVEVIIARTTFSGYRIIALGCTGDVVRDENGEPMLFLGNITSLSSRILGDTDVMNLTRLSDKKSNILSPDGKFLLKNWYDEVLFIPRSNICIVINDDKYNVAKLGGDVISETWYDEIEHVSEKLFLCTDDEYRKYLMSNDGKLMFDGESFEKAKQLRVKTVRDVLGGKNFEGKIVACLKKEGEPYKFANSDAKVIEFGRPVMSVRAIQSGINEITDPNGNINLIGADYKTISENWFKAIHFRPTDVNPTGRVGIPLFKALLNDKEYMMFSDKSFEPFSDGSKFTVSKHVGKTKYMDPLICIKRSDGKCNIYSLDKLSSPMSKEWLDDIYETDTEFMIVRLGSTYRILFPSSNTTAKFVDGKEIIKLPYNSQLGKVFFIIKNNGKFSVATYGSMCGYADVLDPKTNKSYEFDAVYDVESRFPIVKKNEKYNFFSPVLIRICFMNEWFEDVEPYDDSGKFDVMINGEWKKISVQ